MGYRSRGDHPTKLALRNTISTTDMPANGVGTMCLLALRFSFIRVVVAA